MHTYTYTNSCVNFIHMIPLVDAGEINIPLLIGHDCCNNVIKETQLELNVFLLYLCLVPWKSFKVYVNLNWLQKNCV